MVPDSYAECVDIGGSKAKTVSLAEPMEKQGQDYCDALNNHPVFNSSDFNVIGLS